MGLPQGEWRDPLASSGLKFGLYCVLIVQGEVTACATVGEEIDCPRSGQQIIVGS